MSPPKSKKSSSSPTVLIPSANAQISPTLSSTEGSSRFTPPILSRTACASARTVAPPVTMLVSKGKANRFPISTTTLISASDVPPKSKKSSSSPTVLIPSADAQISPTLSSTEGSSRFTPPILSRTACASARTVAPPVTMLVSKGKANRFPISTTTLISASDVPPKSKKSSSSPTVLIPSANAQISPTLSSTEGSSRFTPPILSRTACASARTVAPPVTMLVSKGKANRFPISTTTLISASDVPPKSKKSSSSPTVLIPSANAQISPTLSSTEGSSRFTPPILSRTACASARTVAPPVTMLVSKGKANRFPISTTTLISASDVPPKSKKSSSSPTVLIPSADAQISPTLSSTEASSRFTPPILSRTACASARTVAPPVTMLVSKGKANRFPISTTTLISASDVPPKSKKSSSSPTVLIPSADAQSAPPLSSTEGSSRFTPPILSRTACASARTVAPPVTMLVSKGKANRFPISTTTLISASDVPPKSKKSSSSPTVLIPSAYAQISPTLSSTEGSSRFTPPILSRTACASARTVAPPVTMLVSKGKANRFPISTTTLISASDVPPKSKKSSSSPTVLIPSANAQISPTLSSTEGSSRFTPPILSRTACASARTVAPPVTMLVSKGKANRFPISTTTLISASDVPPKSKKSSSSPTVLIPSANAQISPTLSSTEGSSRFTPPILSRTACASARTVAPPVTMLVSKGKANRFPISTTTLISASDVPPKSKKSSSSPTVLIPSANAQISPTLSSTEGSSRFTPPILSRTACASARTVAPPVTMLVSKGKANRFPISTTTLISASDVPPKSKKSSSSPTVLIPSADAQISPTLSSTEGSSRFTPPILSRTACASARTGAPPVTMLVSSGKAKRFPISTTTLISASDVPPKSKKSSSSPTVLIPSADAQISPTE